MWSRKMDRNCVAMAFAKKGLNKAKVILPSTLKKKKLTAHCSWNKRWDWKDKQLRTVAKVWGYFLSLVIVTFFSKKGPWQLKKGGSGGRHCWFPFVLSKSRLYHHRNFFVDERSSSHVCDVVAHLSISSIAVCSRLGVICRADPGTRNDEWIS